LIADELVCASLDGAEMDRYSYDGSRIPLEVTAGDHEVTVRARCPYSRSGDGLHRFVDPVDQRTYLYTQFEVADARRVYACFEQPDLKARFRVSVSAPESWVVVSNAAELETSVAGRGVRRTRFAETLPMSTYLTALVAGDYHRVSGPQLGRHGRVPTSLLCRRSVVEHLDAEAIFAVTASGFDVFEEHFGHPYPFGKYDQAFVPEYNGGAMENIGCVTLRDDYLFRSKVTQASLHYRRDTILHELSHMWFGDLVTMRWWDDLWLKESFATWAACFAIGERADDPAQPWASFCSGSKTFAYRQDQLPSTHPVAADIVDLEAIEYNFDQITYAKGAAVLVQLVAYVGRAAFLRGIRSYFAEHAYRNTSLPDLLRSLEQASGRDLAAWSAQWLETAGLNTLRLALTVDDHDVITSAAVEQRAPAGLPTLRSHRIAVGCYALQSGRLERVERFELDVSGARTPVPELVGRARPAAIVINDDDLGYTKIRLDPRSSEMIQQHLPDISSVLTRALLWGALWDACRDAELAPARYVELALRGVVAETDATAVRSILGQGGVAAYSYAAPARRSELADRWTTGLHERLVDAAAGSDLQLALARAFVTSANPGWAADLVHGWLEGVAVPAGLTIDADLRWLLVSNLSRMGRLDRDAIAAEERRDGTITGSEQAAGARAALPSAEAKTEAWRLAVTEDGITNTMQSAICLGFWVRGQDEVLKPYVERYFRAVEDISALRGVWATKADSLRKNVLRLLFPWPLDKQALLDRLDPWLAEAPLSSSARRVIEERRDDAARALRCQRADAG
jgi:aminopeptidase N